MNKTLEEENKMLKEELKKRSDDYREIEKRLIDVCQLTFSKYHQNEWANCLSYMDDISPIVDKMRELEKEWNEFYNKYKERHTLFLKTLCMEKHQNKGYDNTKDEVFSRTTKINEQREEGLNDRRNDC